MFVHTCFCSQFFFQVRTIVPKLTNSENLNNVKLVQGQIEGDGNGATGFSNYAQAYRIRNSNSGLGLYTGFGASHARNPGHGESSSSSNRSSMPRLMGQEDFFWAGEASASMQFGDAFVPATAFSQQTQNDNGGELGMSGTPTNVSQTITPDYWIAPLSGAMVGNGAGGASLMAGAQIPTYPSTQAVQESSSGKPASISSDKSAPISSNVYPLARARMPTSVREPGIQNVIINFYFMLFFFIQNDEKKQNSNNNNCIFLKFLAQYGSLQVC